MMIEGSLLLIHRTLAPIKKVIILPGRRLDVEEESISLLIIGPRSLTRICKPPAISPMCFVTWRDKGVYHGRPAVPT